MKQIHNDPSRRSSVQLPVLLGLFVGVALGLGYLLAGVPNVELMTVTVALGGAVMGPAAGALCGALAAGIFSLASPIGAPLPLVLAAQVTGMADPYTVHIETEHGVSTAFRPTGIIMVARDALDIYPFNIKKIFYSSSFNLTHCFPYLSINFSCSLCSKIFFDSKVI